MLAHLRPSSKQKAERLRALLAEDFPPPLLAWGALRIVAVWRDEDGTLYVLPPCGRCREFIRQIDPANLDTQVILGRDTRVALHNLLPRTQWPDPF